MKIGYVYILANKKNGTLYTGVTSNLVKRIHQHKSKYIQGFTKKYNVTKLVYYEKLDNITDAIKREKNIKAWKRIWKIELIKSININWEDLYNKII